jgi:hypothetical protein
VASGSNLEDFGGLAVGSALRPSADELSAATDRGVRRRGAAADAEHRGGIQLDLRSGKRLDVVTVFFRALFFSSLLAIVPIAVLWLLDRHAHEMPWRFAVAFFWGACIATGLALPVNTAFSRIADACVAQNPGIEEVLGPDTASMLAAPISAPIVAELAKPVERGQIVRDRAFRTRRIGRMHRRAARVNARHEIAFRKRRVRNEAKDLGREEIRRLRHAEEGAPFSPPSPERPPSADDYRAGR